MPLSPDLDAALSVRVPPVRTHAGYRAASAGVAVGMVLLPLIYIALVVGLAWGVVWYGMNATGILGRGGFATVVGYFGPLVIGALVVAALVKPLFAPRRKKSEPVSLSPEAEPELFAFVGKLADAVGAPRPRRIDVDCRANASASFRRGVLSMGGNDLVLTIGLPLAAALPVRGLAGVLAHEFGHFAQGGGMRMTYLVESISAWFARVVYERDVFDEKLERAANSTRGWIGLVLGLAMYGVIMGRWVLRMLMNIGRRLSRGLLRQMEFDADLYEVRVSGVESFRDTSDRLVLLGAAENEAYNDLDIRVRERRVPDDLPALIEATRAEIPPESATALLGHVYAARTGSLDTHPAVAERVASAEREGGDGLPFPEMPARTLFADFDALAKRATAAFYDEVLVGQGVPVALVSTSQTLSDRAAEAAAFSALQRVTLGSADLPPLAPELLSSAPPEDARAALASARDRLQGLAPEARVASERLGEAAEAHVMADQALALARSAVRFSAKDYGLDTLSAEAAHARMQAMAEAREAARDELGPFHEALRDRVRAALASASVQDDSPLALGDAAGWLAALGAIESEKDALHGLQSRYARAAALIEAVIAREQSGQADEYLAQRALEEASALRDVLAGLRQRLEAVAYPFLHGEADVTLGRYIVNAIPERKAIGDLLGAAQEAVSRAQEVRVRVWSNLAEIVEHVEASFDLTPLPEPLAPLQPGEPTATDVEAPPER